MVDKLSALTSEVTRVVLEVGTQGILDGHATIEARTMNLGRPHSPYPSSPLSSLS
ncbi:hypothetical protein H2248_012159 [Termitomyces sp. 'cryptogamus']|nr:hypothetical protein H2248_012159 [Termitomyces sp. 'cryptogamus']